MAQGQSAISFLLLYTHLHITGLKAIYHLHIALSHIITPHVFVTVLRRVYNAHMNLVSQSRNALI